MPPGRPVLQPLVLPLVHLLRLVQNQQQQQPHPQVIFFYNLSRFDAMQFTALSDMRLQRPRGSLDWQSQLFRLLAFQY